jgi:DNA-binding NarL/FixJ family response regulator
MLSANCYQVLLIDDHAIVRDGLTALINKEQDMHVCGTAHDAFSALNILSVIKPEIVIVDLSLASASGLDVIVSIKALYTDVRIIVFSMHDELVFAERCIKAGASGYIMKNDEPRELINAIRKILSGKIYLSEKMTEYVLNKAMQVKDTQYTDIIETLSDREFQVFQFIGQGHPSKQIAANLNLGIKTIETYREKLKHKLGLANALDLTQYAIKWVNSHNIMT